ncbi:YkgJ family cysteine cluster protein [bacterium]|nr:YkgJ family cysteine cluster protein [bacterium]
MINSLKKDILENYDRLKLDDSFNFSCHKKIACFNQCCRDINIFLTPYDVLRMNNRLGISSEDFLREYTISPFTKEQKLPLVVLKMGDDPEKKCPFVTDGGCKIYDDRPWPCRMYPLGLASPGGELKDEEEFYFLMKEPDCLGLKEKKSYTIRSWLDDQGLNLYNELGNLFKEITLHPYFKENDLSPEKMEMFYMACYDLDRFRNFVFESKFLKYFEVDNSIVKKIKDDDVELMKFAFEWLKFSLFGEKTIKVKDHVIEERKKKNPQQ